MADDAKTDGNGLIRQVRKILGPTTHGGGLRRLVVQPQRQRRDREPARRRGSPRNAREALEFIAEQAERPAQGRASAARPPARQTACRHRPCWRSSTTTCRSWWTRCWPRSQARGLQIALLLHPIFKTRRDRAGRLQSIDGPGDGSVERRPPGELHRRPPAGAAGGGRAPISAQRVSAILRQVRVVVADWKPMLQAVKAAIGALELAPASIPPPSADRVDRFPGMAGAGQLHLPRRARVRVVGRPQDGRPGVRGRQRARRAARRVGAGAAARQRAGGDDARDPPLLLRGFASDHHQGERDRPRCTGARTWTTSASRPIAPTARPRARSASSACSRRSRTSPRLARCPFLRHKVDAVLGALGYPPSSHDSKAILNILESFPRDELFQIGVEAAQRVGAGHPRSGDAAARARVRPRRPLRPVRLRCSSMCRATATPRWCASGSASCWRRPTTDASSAFYPHFTDGPLVRVQFIVARYAGRTPEVDAASSSTKIIEIIRTWEDRLVRCHIRVGGDAEARRS